MFVRTKKSGAYQYLQLVHNERVDGKVRQQVLATLGRLDVLQKTGQIDALIGSCGRFAEHTAVLDAHRQGQTEVAATIKIGPSLVFERLWNQLGLPTILEEVLAARRFEFAVERAVFLTVLHRLFDPVPAYAGRPCGRGMAVRLRDRGARETGVAPPLSYDGLAGRAVAQRPTSLGHAVWAAMHQGPHRRVALCPAARPV